MHTEVQGTGGLVARQGALAPILAATLADIINALAVGRYNLAGVVLANGDAGELQLNAAGALLVASGVAPIVVVPVNTLVANSGTDVDTLVVSALPCRLCGVFGYNATALTLYVFVCNLAAGPPAFPPAVLPIAVPPGALFSFTPPETNMAVGLVVGWSTSRVAYGAPAANAGWLTVFYR